MLFICPLCHESMFAEAKSYRCPQGHQFDKAKEGYVNLLPVQHKRSKDPGDSSEMMLARREFLEAGHYHALRQAIGELLAQALPARVETILDIGCGEGYYTAWFAGLAHDRGGETCGLDVSKAAIRFAARRYPQVQFCVASSHRLPFDDASLDAVIRIYAPCKAEELARVVKPGGVVITAAPGPRHLFQLKGLIYDNVKLHEPDTETLAGFRLAQQCELAYPMTLNGNEAAALLQMTPFAWRARPEVWQALREKAEFACETDFCLRVWVREA